MSVPVKDRQHQRESNFSFQRFQHSAGRIGAPTYGSNGKRRAESLDPDKTLGIFVVIALSKIILIFGETARVSSAYGHRLTFA